MRGGAVDAYENTVRDGGPGGILGAAVEAGLVAGERAQALQNRVNVRFRWFLRRHGCVFFSSSFFPFSFRI
jgi:hypothetical protein